MPAIAWNQLHNRLYEVGVDRVVLYPSNKPGVAWTGVTEIIENYATRTLTPQYFEGRKFSDAIQRGEFQASISSYNVPDDFAPMEGLFEAAPGLFAANQPRVPFSLSYRTLIGDPVQGLNAGYKLHFVYGALAFPSTRSYKTIDKVTDPVVRIWSIICIPYFRNEYVWFRGSYDSPLLKHQNPVFPPVSHIAVSSRTVNPENLAALENIIYGTETTEPEIPTPPQLIEIVR